MFKNIKRPVEKKIDPKTGEVQYVQEGVDNNPQNIPTSGTPWVRNLPDLKKARTIQEITWPAVPVVGLVYHPEYNGRKIAICKVAFGESDYGMNVKLSCFELDANDNPISAVVIVTMSEDIMTRVSAIADIISPDSPVVGTLRASGRAWFLE